jgi:hypothetical protein
MHTLAPPRRWLAALAGALLVLGTTAHVTAAEPLQPSTTNELGSEWSTFVQRQPILSRMVISHQTAAVASVLGISVDQLRAEARGRTLSEVAADHGRTNADVAQAMVDAARSDLRAATLFGVLTPDAAADLAAQMTAIVPSLVESPVPPELLGV